MRLLLHHYLFSFRGDYSTIFYTKFNPLIHKALNKSVSFFFSYFPYFLKLPRHKKENICFFIVDVCSSFSISAREPNWSDRYRSLCVYIFKIRFGDARELCQVLQFYIQAVGELVNLVVSSTA